MSAPAIDRFELKAIFDNPATFRREIWVDGHLVRWIAAAVFEHRPAAAWILRNDPNMAGHFKPGRLQGSAAAIGAPALEQVEVAAVAAQLRAAEIAAAALRRALRGAERQLRELDARRPIGGTLEEHRAYLHAAGLVAAAAREAEAGVTWPASSATARDAT